MKIVVLLKIVFAFVGLTTAASVSALGITLEEFEDMIGELMPHVTVDGTLQTFPIAPIFDFESEAQGVGAPLVIGYTVPQTTLVFGEDQDRVETDGASFVLFDPVITLGFGVVDFGAPSSFTVTTAAPLVPPITGKAAGLLSIAGSFSDGASDGGSVTPFSTPLIAQATIEGAAVADAGPPMVLVTPSDVYGPYSVPYSFDCSALGDGKCDSFDLGVSFMGSGGSDAFSFTARHEINAVPLPAALPLFLSAVFGLGAIARRKRKPMAV